MWLIKNVAIFHNFTRPIFPATSLFIVAIIIALLTSFYLTKKLPIMPLVSAVFVIILGGLTLWFHDSTFIKMKPTIVNTLMGCFLLIGVYFKRYLLSYIFGEAFKVDNEGWRILSLRWGLFFIFLAITNEVVWRNFSTNTWTNFKVFIISPLSVIFFFAQIPLIMRHSLEN